MNGTLNLCVIITEFLGVQFLGVSSRDGVLIQSCLTWFFILDYQIHHIYLIFFTSQNLEECWIEDQYYWLV